MVTQEPDWRSLEKSENDEESAMRWSDIFYGKYLQIDLHAVEIFKKKLNMDQAIHLHTQPASRVREYQAGGGGRDVNAAERSRNFRKESKPEGTMAFQMRQWTLHIRLPLQQLAEQVEAQSHLQMDNPAFWTKYAQVVNAELIKYVGAGYREIADTFVSLNCIAQVQKWQFMLTNWLFSCICMGIIMGKLIGGHEFTLIDIPCAFLIWISMYMLWGLFILWVRIELRTLTEEEVKLTHPSLVCVKQFDNQIFAENLVMYTLNMVLPYRYAEIYLAPAAKSKLLELFWRPTLIRSAPPK